MKINRRHFLRMLCSLPVLGLLPRLKDRQIETVRKPNVHSDNVDEVNPYIRRYAWLRAAAAKSLREVCEEKRQQVKKPKDLLCDVTVTTEFATAPSYPYEKVQIYTLPSEEMAEAYMKDKMFLEGFGTGPVLGCVSTQPPAVYGIQSPEDIAARIQAVAAVFWQAVRKMVKENNTGGYSERLKRITKM